MDSGLVSTITLQTWASSWAAVESGRGFRERKRGKEGIVDLSGVSTTTTLFTGTSPWVVVDFISSELTHVSLLANRMS